MEEKSDSERLVEIVRTVIDYQTPSGLFGDLVAPFDTTKPNLHDSKSEFLAEQSAVEQGLRDARGLLAFLSGYSDQGIETKSAPQNLLDHLDEEIWNRRSLKKPSDASALAAKVVADAGYRLPMSYCLLDLIFALRVREIELQDQEREFWSNNHRPPNHYARIIALRFARLVAQRTGKKPTFGTSRDGGHPSTAFGRALEEIFKVLKIRANVKNAATWAIGQLGPQDTSPIVNALLGISQNNSTGSNTIGNALSRYIDEQKGRAQ